MPPKHKTSEAAVNNGGTSSDSNLNLNSSAVAPGAEQPRRDDDLEQALAWIEKGGRLDAKRLAKRLPQSTAQGLVDGSTDPSVLADMLVNCLKERTAATAAATADGTVRLAGGIGTSGSAGNGEKRAKLMDLMAYVFTFQALPPLECDDDDLHYEFYCDWKESFWQAVIDCQSSSEPGDVLLTKNVKRAFDETCLSWEGRLTARFFRGSPRGAFRRSCPLFNAPLEDFERVINEDFHSKVDLNADRMNADTAKRLSYELGMAASGISQGLDQVFKTCWECNAALKMKNECSGCNVAFYCGKACQVKAWKGGHKKACQNLKERHERWKDARSVVDAAHVSGMLHGIQLRADWDYILLSALYSLESPYKNSSCERIIGGASMKAFYENLGRVIRGEWWFYHNATSVSEYKEFIEANGKTVTDEQNYFFMLSIFLSFDYFKHEPDPEVNTSMFDSTSFVIQSSEGFGIPMPAERFVEMYKKIKIATTNDERLRVRTQTNAQTWSAFRNSLHKAGPDH
jgi:hypothetical protein